MSLLSLALLAAPWAAAQDVPATLHHQGRLLDAEGTPLEGSQTLRFSLYDVASGGAALWTDARELVLDNGYYSVTLGDGTALDPAVFTGEPLFVGIAVGSEELPQRVALHSVPYALKSGVAENATGALTPTSVTIGGVVIDVNGISVGGAPVIDSSGAITGDLPEISFSDLVDAPTTLGSLGCTDGQIPRFELGEWACGEDEDTDTTYTAGDGLTLASGAFAVDFGAAQKRVTGTCQPGTFLTAVNADGTVVCAPDANTTYTAATGAGLTLSGTAFSADTAYLQRRVGTGCPNPNQSIKTINADGSVTCEADDLGTLTYSAGDRLIYAQDAEVMLLENNSGSGFVKMNETTVARGGNLRLGFEAYIQSGPDWFSWQVTVDGTAVASGSYAQGLHSSNTSSVHAYRRFQVDLSNVPAGGRVAVHLRGANSAGSAPGGANDQRLFMKRFRLYNNLPTQEGGVYTAATWRGRITDAGRTSVVNANSGPAPFEALIDGNPDVFEVVTSGNYGVRIKQAGHIMWQYDQDIITGSGGNYAILRAVVGDGRDSHYTLMRPSSGLWDSINNGGVAQVGPGDVLRFEYGCSGCDITAMDSQNWSNLSIFWMGHLDP